MKKVTLILLALLSQSANLQAAITDANAYSNLSLWNPYAGTNPQQIEYTFGTHTLADFNTASSIIGADANGTPFVAFSASSANSDYLPAVDARLEYRWKVTNNDGSTAPVLVHISTAGVVDSIYGYTPKNPPSPFVSYNSYNNANAGLRADFVTFDTPGHADFRSYGVTVGNTAYNTSNGVIHNLGPVYAPMNGGTVSNHGEFNQTFDFWVAPNVENIVYLSVNGGLGFDSNVHSIATESFAVNGYINAPAITIDSATIGNNTLEMSNIAAVPLPGAVWLFLSGILGLLGSEKSRKV